MLGHMNITNGEGFFKAIADMQCGRTHIAQISTKDFEIEQFTTKPVEGYIAPENFPNCCELHKSLMKAGLERFNEFPNCCENHKKLKDCTWFKKEKYSYLPYKLATTNSYSWHGIMKHIEDKDWYKKITDYITYTVDSFGQFPDGYGSPLGLSTYISALEGNIKNAQEISPDKSEKLLQFLKFETTPNSQESETDLNLLIGKYQEWVKIFPFEISFLSHLKPYFDRQIPLLSGPGEKNIYTGATGFRIISKKELVTLLKSITTRIIKEFNTRELYLKDLLPNRESVSLELLLAKRKLEMEELEKSDWEDRKGYIKLLKKWLKGEKEFVKEIVKLFPKKEKFDFISDLLQGMWTLQKNDTNETCIMNVRKNLPGKETGFRYWFRNYFIARYREATVVPEEEKGDGRIDLKVAHKSFGEKIIEFKGWWNQDKKFSPEQICSYLTDFENEGYVFLINHLAKKQIVEDYKKLVESSAMKYVPNSWKEHKYENTDMFYYESKHHFGVKEKTVFHFIFNVHF